MIRATLRRLLYCMTALLGSTAAYGADGAATILTDANSLPGHESALRAVSFSQNGKWLASVDASGLLILWETEHWSTVGTIVKSGNGRSVTFIDNERVAATWGASSDEKPAVVVWDRRTFRPVAKLPIALIGEAQRVRGHSSARYLLSAVQYPNGGWVIETDPHERQIGTLDLWSSSNLNRFSTSRADAPVKSDLSLFEKHREISEYAHGVSDLDISAAAITLVAGGTSGLVDGSMAGFNVPEGRLLWRRILPRQPIESICLCDADRSVATSGRPRFGIQLEEATYRKIWIWDAATGEPKADWFAHEGRVACLASCESQKAIASGGEDGRVKLWRVPSWQLMAEMDTGLKEVSCIAFSPDGLFVVAGGPGGRLLVMRVAAQKPSHAK